MSRFVMTACLLTGIHLSAHSEDLSLDLFARRGFDSQQISVPGSADEFPVSRLENVQFSTVATFELFPEGPSYRPTDDSYFYSGNLALTRVDRNGSTHEALGKPGGGGTHFLPDGSVLIIGHVGLRRLYPDGRIALLADGAKIGAGNDLTVGVDGEVYFSVPKSGIYRLTPGLDGELERVVKQGCNGLDVDPSGKFLYVVRGGVQRYPLHGVDHALGPAETVLELPKGEGGGDGCTFDAWGNFYSMHFKTGVIRVVDPDRRKLIATIPTGVAPASNLTFGGPRNTELFVTAGAPRLNNCQVMIAELDITGFCGHAGASDYRVVRFLDEKGNVAAFSGRSAAATGPASAIRFPADSGVLAVTDYGAIPNDGCDDTAGIQKALDQFPNGNRIIYLPPGEYHVTNTLRWPDGPHGGTKQKRTILQGAGRDLTTIRVPDNTRAFVGSDNGSKAVIWTGSKPAQRFRNAIRDLTVNTGSGNPGAIGIQFNASNQGTIRNVAIVSDDGQGVYGLDLGHTDEIGPLLVRNLTVDGFDEGIRTWWPVNSCTFEHITLRNQNRYGWHNYHQMIFVRGLHSENRVPALFNRKDSWGTVTLIDSELKGLPGSESRPGILNQRQLYIRNTRISGYGQSINNADKGRDKGDVDQPGLIVEDTSHRNVASLFRKLDGDTLPPERFHLPAKETPEIEWGDVDRDWVNIVSFGADPDGKQDSSKALQAAIDSGASTVYLPGGAHFRFNGEVRIRGPVQRIIGLECRCRFDEQAVWKLVDGDAPASQPDADAVIIERCSGVSGGRSIPIIHESKRTLIVSSWIGAHVIGRGSGDIFLDDFCGRLDLESSEHHAWCRQLNTEREGTMLTNNGATLWILGMKTEKIGTIIHTRNGGRTDLIGCFVYSNRGWDESVPAFVIEDSKVSLSGLNERNFNRNPVSVWFHESQNGEIRSSKDRAWAYVGR